MRPSPAPPSRSRSTPRQWWRHPLWAPLNEVAAWDRLLSLTNPVRSLTETRARVVRVVDEAPGVRSLWLRWRPPRAAASSHATPKET